MALVKIITNCCVWRDGKGYFPDSDPFEVPDTLADELEASGKVSRTVVGVVASLPVEVPEEVELGLDDLPCMTSALLDTLVEASIETPADVADASLDALVELDGIGRVKAKRLKDEALALLDMDD